MFEYDEDAKMASEELDKYNFKYILGLCYDSDIRDPYDIKDYIISSLPELEEILEYLTEDEWMEYLTERYPIRFEEIIKYRMYYRR